MPQAFIGSTGVTVHGKWDNLRLAVHNYPFINAGGRFQSMSPGLREDSKLAINGRQIVDVNGIPFPYGHDITGELTLMQGDLATLMNIYYMCGTLFQMQFKDAKGKWMNFTPDLAGLSGPDGSTELGATFDYTLTPKDRKIMMKLNGYLFQEELDYLLGATSTGSAATGGASTTTPVWPLTAVGRVKSRVRAPGAVSFIYNGVSVGDIKDFKLNITSDGPADQFGRKTSNEITTKLELTMRQTDALSLLAASNQSVLDAAATLNIAGGESIVWSSAALGFTTKYTFDEKERFVVLSAQAKFTYNASEAAPSTVDFSVPNVLTLTESGYN